MTIAVDFDGVLHDHLSVIEGRKMGKDVPGAFEAMTRLREQGHTLIIYTQRAQPGIDLLYLDDWLRYYRIPYDKIALTKPDADIYLDDKAIHFESWPETLTIIDEN